MKHVFPPCPSCEEDDLWLNRMGDTFEIKCKECGWNSGIVTLTTGQDLSTVIAETVAAYDDWLERARQIDPGDEMPPFMLLALLGEKPPAPIDSDTESC